MCFSGRIKSYEDSVEWFRTQLSKFDIDTFISINGVLDKYHQDFIDQCNVKLAHFEEYKLPYDEKLFSGRKRHETSIYNFHSMWYNRKKCVELVEQYQKMKGIKYDVIVQFRADIISRHDFIVRCTGDNDVTIPIGNDWGGVNDQIAYGNVLAMKVYATLYDNIRTYVLDDGVTFHPETLNKHHINKLGLVLHREKFHYYLNHRRS